MNAHHDWIGWTCVGFALASAAILLHFLIKKPELDGAVKVRLLFGLGVFPILTAGTSNVRGFAATQSREFCGSCHVMSAHAADVNDPKSTSLAAIHGRNPYFGKENCYSCHKDYGMYGYLITKMGGMGHVYNYLTEYRTMPLEQAKKQIRIKRPFPNSNCMECHTTEGPRWLKVGDHASSLDGVRSGKVACASAGCHGFAHPFTKDPAP